MRLAELIVATGVLIVALVGCNGASSDKGPGPRATQAVSAHTATATAAAAFTPTGEASVSSGGGATAGAGTPLTTVATAPASSPSADGEELIVGLDKNGQSIQLRVGQTFLLKLGADLNWAVEVTDQTVVSRVPNIAVIRGAQGVYRALRAGSTDLSGIGDPFCRSTTPPCAAPSLFFRLSISVID